MPHQKRCLIVAILAVLASCAEARDTYWNAELVWSLEYPDGLPFELFDKQQNNVRANLLGACVVGDDVVIYNRISNQVERMDGKGTLLWSTGSIGQGPEDHNVPCDVRILTSGTIALCDYSGSPKVVYYDSDGSYLGSVGLRGYSQCHRMEFDDHELISAMMSKMGRDEQGGYVVDVVIVKYDRDGIPVANRTLNSVTLTRGEQASESDLWPFPRIEVAGNGWVYWQPDLQYERVEILDEDLKTVGALGDGALGLPRSASEIDSVITAFAGNVKPMKGHHAIWNMSLRPDGSLWIMPRAPEEESLFFRSYRQGEGTPGMVTVMGVGREPGEFALDRDGNLLFVGCPDPETSAMTCVRLYRLGSVD